MARSWYPHHMMQAGKRLADFAAVTDAYLYVVDARAPLTSFCPEHLPEGARVIVVINKCDLVSGADVSRWKEWYSKEYACFQLIAVKKRSCTDLAASVKKAVGRNIVYAVLVGIPNVGKSMFIKSVTGSKIKTGTRPGVTTNVTWLKSKNGLNLADTPGVLWPRLEDDDIFARLCLIDAVGEKMADFPLAARWLISRLAGTGIPEERYGMDLSEDWTVNLERFSVKIGKSGDTEACCRTIVRDFQAGRLGRLVLDEIPQHKD